MPKNESIRRYSSPKTGKKVGSDDKTYLRRSSEPRTSSSGATPFIEDNTEGQGIKRARSETERLLRAILDNVPAGISYLDKKEQFQFANQRYEFLLGIEADALIGTTLEQALGKNPYKVAGKFAKRALKGEIVSFENVLRPGTGGEISVLVSYVPDVGPDDVVRGFYALVEDISENKRLEARLRDRQKNLEAEVSERTSEINKAYEELEKSEAILNEAQRIAKIGSWEWNIETNESWWSDEVHRLFGTDRQSFEANYEAFLERVHPDDRKLVGDSVQRALDKGEEHSIDHRIIMTDGTERIVHEQAEVAYDADGRPIRMTGTVQDISEQKRIEGTLADQRDRLRRLLESTNAVPWEAKMESGSFSYVGPQAVELLGYPQEKWLGEDFWTVHMHPDDRDWVPGYCVDMAGKGHDFEFEYRMMAKDGRVVWLHEIVHVIREDGRPTVLQGFLIDITERKRVEKALHDSERRARRLQADLHHVARVSAMGEMASTLAHELNQPLAALTNYVQAARKTMKGRDAGDRRKVAEYIENAVAQSTRASEIIRGLRKFVTKGEAERSFNDINTLIEEAVLLTVPEGKINEIAIETKLAPDLPPILVEKIRIQQVVVNLVRNGIEALSDTDSGLLCVTTALTADDYIEVTVTDNGPGLAEEMSDKLFQSFVTTKPQGMGVGLSICRSIIENHAGRIWAESNSDGGMSFHFTLPILPQDDSADE